MSRTRQKYHFTPRIGWTNDPRRLETGCQAQENIDKQNIKYI